ncbi:S8 family serine peptidase [Deinococcus deserti]|uniref:Putative Serine protease, subtilase family, (Peptidase_S8) n=1 Tax=Deinococcus deserti (strain DSM 17065 / CIP 109153 / LMG 22923 / VCD115) TaxID=546414 RepID=C1CV85_DEIDV|nr:S8 family serine peptidase [Deinococcus deserti]ACO46102.1 putative Serine protease, subtilase family, precursor (Peptidase_S8) [Deinococcus deserti VCD115]
MKKLSGSWPILLTLPLLLAACTDNFTTPIVEPPVVQPPAPQPPAPQPPAPQPPSASLPASVNLGYGFSAPVQAAHSGSWQVIDQPAWLSVTPTSGTGEIRLAVAADRSKATPLAADQAKLTGAVILELTAPDKTRTRATITVSADQYRMTGRVADTAKISGQALVTSPINRARPAEARGILVKYRDRVSSSDLVAQSAAQSPATRSREVLSRAGVTVQSARSLNGGLAALKVTDQAAALRALRQNPEVEYAVPNAVLHIQQTSQALAAPLEPTDQYAPLQWPFKLMGYPAVWRDMESGTYNRAVTVAVVDSGVRFDHPDLAGQLWGPAEGALDVLNEPDNGDGDGVDTDPTDPSVSGRSTGSHGTHVTGIIVARWGENAGNCAGCSGTGVVGASYRAPVKVLPIRAIDATGDATVEHIVQALNYAAGLPTLIGGVTYTNPRRAQVINLSLGGAISAEQARPLCDAVHAAKSAGSLVFVAAGNAYGTTPYYPAACPGAVAVGSVTLSGGSAPRHASYSNAYPEVQLSAPGGTDQFSDVFNGGLLNNKAFPDMVFSTGWDYVKNEPQYEAMSGTSQATPQVSALAALLLSKGVTSDAAGTLARLTATATDLGAQGRDDQFGFGMVNAAAALGAPAISDTLGLRLQNARGFVFQPRLDNLGRFEAYLGDGTFRVVGGRDRDRNQIYGETHEPRDERTVKLGPDTPQVELGTLEPK